MPNYRRRRKAQGLCTTCGKVPPGTGKTLCQACLCRLSEEQRRIRARRKQRKVCQRCTKPLDGNSPIHCSECLEYTRAKHKDAYRRRVLTGRCGHCNNPARPGRRSCPDCAAKQVEASKR